MIRWVWLALNAPTSADPPGLLADLQALVNRLNEQMLALQNTLGATDRVGTAASGDTTPIVSGLRVLVTANAAPTSIASFKGGTAGQLLALVIGDANTTLVHSATLVLIGAANWVGSAGNTKFFITETGAVWREVANPAVWS